MCNFRAKSILDYKNLNSSINQMPFLFEVLDKLYDSLRETEDT